MTATLFDSAESVIAMKTVPAMVRHITSTRGDRRRTPFEVVFDTSPGFDHYRLTVQGAGTGTFPIRGLNFTQFAPVRRHAVETVTSPGRFATTAARPSTHWVCSSRCMTRWAVSSTWPRHRRARSMSAPAASHCSTPPSPIGSHRGTDGWRFPTPFPRPSPASPGALEERAQRRCTAPQERQPHAGPMPPI